MAYGSGDANPWSTSLGFEGNAPYNKDAVLRNGSGRIVGAPRFVDIGNIQQGGQLGFGPRVVAMDGGTPLALNAAHIYVLQMPRMWDKFPVTQQQYKSMIELNAVTIDNVDINYTMDFGDVEAGHDGQMASMPLKTKRAPVSPSVTLNDTIGNVFWNLNYLWLKHINHPDTCCSLLSAIMDESEVPDWVWSTFTMTWLVIQPDPTGLPNRLVEAAVITNIIPSETGTLGMKRQIGSAEIAKRTVSYKGRLTHSEATRELGRLVMLATNAHKPNLDYAITWDGTQANINGYGHQGWMDVAKSDGLMKLYGTSFVKQANAAYGATTLGDATMSAARDVIDQVNQDVGRQVIGN